LLLNPIAFADDTIVVTATRSGTQTRDLPAAIQTVKGQDWERKGGRPEEALSGVTGLTVTANGGPGQLRSVLLRGANSEHTLVLVDGIPVNDPLHPSRGFNFGQIPVGRIERVEVLKGPQSVLYGSDALAGVVQIFTKRADYAPAARAEIGSFGTVRSDFSVFGLSGGFERSDGISAADERDGNQERDGHRAWYLNGDKDFSLGEDWLLTLRARYRDATTDTDKNGGPGGDSHGTYTKNSQLLFRAETLYAPAEGWEWKLAGSASDNERDDNTFTPSHYDARIWKAETSVRKQLSAHSLTAGAEHWQEAGRSTDFTGRKLFRNTGLFLHDQYAKDRWQATLGLRRDAHSQHEAANTYAGGIGYWLEPDTLRVKTNLGTGFKAPSLYQIFSSVGNEHLRPEESLGADIGFEFFSENWDSEISWYQIRFRDLIDYNTATNRYFNVHSARSRGVEWTLTRRLGAFTITNALTTIHAVNRNTGALLLNRPRVQDTLEIGYRARSWGTNARARYVGNRVNYHPTLNTNQSMPTFVTFGADAYYQWKPKARFFARGENLSNRHYQEVSGYGTPGLSAYLGIEAEL
jgi:vitamin B12 transporter